MGCEVQVFWIFFTFYVPLWLCCFYNCWALFKGASNGNHVSHTLMVRVMLRPHSQRPV